MIRIHTIGAGGGSIARMDSGGALRVGPESAGAAPGPICYGQGGDECTITDAHLWLGRLHPNHFLGGTMSLQAKRVAAPMKRLAKQLGLSADETADGIIQVANANMSRALRVISLERGYDPREFTLVAFGGAGGLHACELAESLAIPRVLIPAHPGILSAFGMAYADWKRDYVYTVLYTERSDTYERLHKVLERLKGQAHRDAKKQGYQQKQLRYQAELDLRYVGQSFELRVPFKKSYARLFMQQHQHRFGYTHKGKPLEIVNVRLQVRVKLNVGAGSPRPKLRHLAGAGTAPLQAKLNPIERSRLYWRKKSWKVNWYDRSQLSIGTKLVGPVHIAEYSATTFVPPGWKLECDQEENMILTPWKR